MTQLSRQNYTDLELSLGRTLTETVAPDKSPFFDDIVAVSTAPVKKRGDHELGFGISADDVGTVSAVLLVLSKPILTFIWENARDVAGQLIKDATDQVRLAFERRLSDWIKHRFHKPSPITVPPEKLDAFIETIKKDAGSAGLDQSATDRLVSALREGMQR